MGTMSAVAAQRLPEADVDVAVDIGVAVDFEVRGQDEAECLPTPAPARKRGGGPKTPEGRARSSMNSKKEGFRSRVHLDEAERAAVERHRKAMTVQYAPRTEQQHWLVGQMAAAAARIDRCDELRPVDLGRVQKRAEDHWDMDREADADRLAARIKRDPHRVQRALTRTRQGVTYLYICLEPLRDLLQAGGEWTEARRDRALDLIGFDPELRDANPLVPELADSQGWTELLTGELELLQERADSLEERDEGDRELAMLGLPMEEDAVTRRLRRGEAEAQRNLKRARDELLRLQALELAGSGTGPRLGLGVAPSFSLASLPSSLTAPEIPSRPEVSERAFEQLQKMSRCFPGLTLVPKESDEVAAEATPADDEALPEPEPELEETPEITPARSSDTRSSHQAGPARRDRKRRRQRQKQARKRGR
jgi:hypothetical protein